MSQNMISFFDQNADNESQQNLDNWMIFQDHKKAIHAVWFFIKVIILPFLTVFDSSLSDFKTWIVFGMSLTESIQFYFLAYESSLKGGQQEKQEINLKINKVMNLITKQEINGQLRDIPVINIFDITSMESWQNIFKLTQSNIKTYNSIKDVVN
ncbi:hypothetical protein PPERSA_05433 [Pseudocohnilembus persalinus]|uniref:Uncharacterized protein n=1 Tax=Pseudocohnilembus persalinus TaxID=266149 RepID=A0A0V0R8N0_PSEPJ|nr:hypothetical protein PPERSA_05433 [Pseudocohnilembus persalinus]|eukprot:KRX10613.1 hypothetical protein PPERSA_05433 [Pseudocohnilembus persalinus]